MNRINSLVQKLASIAPKAAPLAFSSLWSTHKITSRLLPYIAALAMGGSVFAAANVVPGQGCNAEQQKYCHDRMYKGCALNSAGYPPNGFYCLWPAFPNPGPVMVLMIPNTIGPVTDASSTLASCLQPAEMSPVKTEFKTSLSAGA
jgi:hypothetical protein